VASAACISFILSDWEQLKERAAKYAPGQGPWPDGIRILVGHNHNQLLHEKALSIWVTTNPWFCVIKPGSMLSTLPSLNYFVPKRTYTKGFPSPKEFAVQLLLILQSKFILGPSKSFTFLAKDMNNDLRVIFLLKVVLRIYILFHS